MALQPIMADTGNLRAVPVSWATITTVGINQVKCAAQIYCDRLRWPCLCSRFCFVALQGPSWKFGLVPMERWGVAWAAGLTSKFTEVCVAATCGAVFRPNDFLRCCLSHTGYLIRGGYGMHRRRHGNLLQKKIWPSARQCWDLSD